MDIQALQNQLVRAREFMDRGAPDQAEEVLNRLQQGRPDLPPVLEMLAELFDHDGRHHQAADLLRRLVSLEPGRADNLARLGKAQLNLGDRDSARASFNRARELEPAHFGAAFGLGALALASHDPAEAEVWFRACVQAQPENPLGHFHLGDVVLGQGRATEACAELTAAARLSQGNPRYLVRLGDGLLEADRPQEALEQFRRAVAVGNGLPPALLALGKALVKLGRPEEGLAEARAYLARHPGEPSLLATLAGVHFAAGDHAAAVENYRAALAVQPGKATWWKNLGLALQNDGRPEEALEAFEKALQLNPELLNARQELANLLKSLGRTEEAGRQFQWLLANHPDQAESLYGLVKMSPPAPDSPLAQTVAGLLAREHGGIREKVLLNFAMGDILDKAGQHSQAFDYYRRGNDLDQGLRLHDRERFDSQFEECLEFFTAGALSGRTADLPESDRLVLIVGMPRSGTTLVEQVLASHSKVFGAGELPFLNDMSASLGPRLGQAEPFPRCLAALSRETAGELGREYLAHLERISQNSPLVTDKMPGNYRHLGLAALILPRARVVHVRRQPLDCCLSQYFQRFADDGLAYTTNFPQLALVYRQYLDLMAHWRAVLPASFLEVDYGQFVADFPAQAARLLDFCGLEWEDRVLQFHRTERRVATASSQQVREGLYTKSLERWKRYGAAVEPLRQALLDQGVPL